MTQCIVRGSLAAGEYVSNAKSDAAVHAFLRHGIDRLAAGRSNRRFAAVNEREVCSATASRVAGYLWVVDGEQNKEVVEAAGSFRRESWQLVRRAKDKMWLYSSLDHLLRFAA